MKLWFLGFILFSLEALTRCARTTRLPVKVSSTTRSPTTSTSTRPPYQGYLSFMLLCEPDSRCVSINTKVDIIECLEKGMSLAATYLYKQCTGQGTITCDDNDTSITVKNCLKAQSGSFANLITDASRQCIREKVTLGNIDCYKINSRLRRSGQKVWSSSGNHMSSMTSGSVLLSPAGDLGKVTSIFEYAASLRLNMTTTSTTSTTTTTPPPSTTLPSRTDQSASNNHYHSVQNEGSFNYVPQASGSTGIRDTFLPPSHTSHSVSTRFAPSNHSPGQHRPSPFDFQGNTRFGGNNNRPGLMRPPNRPSQGQHPPPQEFSYEYIEYDDGQPEEIFNTPTRMPFRSNFHNQNRNNQRTRVFRKERRAAPQTSFTSSNYGDRKTIIPRSNVSFRSDKVRPMINAMRRTVFQENEDEDELRTGHDEVGKRRVIVNHNRSSAFSLDQRNEYPSSSLTASSQRSSLLHEEPSSQVIASLSGITYDDSSPDIIHDSQSVSYFLL